MGTPSSCSQDITAITVPHIALYNHYLTRILVVYVGIYLGYTSGTLPRVPNFCLRHLNSMLPGSGISGSRHQGLPLAMRQCRVVAWRSKSFQKNMVVFQDPRSILDHFSIWHLQKKTPLIFWSGLRLWKRSKELNLEVPRVLSRIRSVTFKLLACDHWAWR